MCQRVNAVDTAFNQRLRLLLQLDADLIDAADGGNDVDLVSNTGLAPRTAVS